MADLKAKLKRNRKAAETSTRPTLNSRKEPPGKTASQPSNPATHTAIHQLDPSLDRFRVARWKTPESRSLVTISKMQPGTEDIATVIKQYYWHYYI